MEREWLVLTYAFKPLHPSLGWPSKAVDGKDRFCKLPVVAVLKVNSRQQDDEFPVSHGMTSKAVNERQHKCKGSRKQFPKQFHSTCACVCKSRGPTGAAVPCTSL